MRRIGIDLGTTNTVAAGEDRVFGIGQEGALSLPSVVAFMPNRRVEIGEVARRRRSIDGMNSIFSSKRIIGRRFHDSVVTEFRNRYPLKLVDSGDGTPVFETRAGQFGATEIASMILSQVHSRVSAALREAEVVITVPAGFGEAQRGATREAARVAGFKTVRLVDEPLATAWAYRSDPDIGGVVAVYDLGGGTFDVSIVDLSGTAPRLLARGSDPYLGGDDVDRQIADWVAREVLKAHNWDLLNYKEVELRLLAECERAKIRLATAEKTRVDLTQVDPECPIAAEGLELRRSVLDQLAGQLVQRTFVVCDNALRDASVRAGDLRAVLLAGGSSYLRVVQQGVAAYFGREPRSDISPTEVVARGASLVA
jgi:molecular chaperone DnaK